MLALVSSITTAVNGCDSFENSERPRACVVQDGEVACSRSGTSRPLRVDDRRVNRDRAHVGLEDRLLFRWASTSGRASRATANTNGDILT